MTDITKSTPASEEAIRGRPTRSEFLRQAAAVALGAVGLTIPAAACEGADADARAAQRKSKGAEASKVSRWDVITIGNLSRNRYWGERDDQRVRPVLATCTLVTGGGFRLLVDPSVSDAEQMKKELDRRTGLKLRDITAVFITHEHGDHYAGLAHFADARWLAAPPVAEILNKSRAVRRPIESVQGRLFDVVEVIATPGHTRSHHSLRFDCDGLSIAVAGDAVATRDFWRERRGFSNSVDFPLAAKTMDRLASIADIVVPGHDNYFVVERVTERRRTTEH